MQLRRTHHWVARATMGGALVATLGIIGLASGGAQAADRGPLVALSRSVPLTTDHIVGPFTARQMSIEIALAPRDERGLNGALRSVYAKGSAEYHHWLSRGQFDERFAPSITTREDVLTYLRTEGLRPVAATSPFVVRAVGSSSAVAAALHTSLNVYRDARGIRYFQNSTAVRIPATFARNVFGVLGLTNTVREHPRLVRPMGVRSLASSDPDTACETGYVTTTELFNSVNNGTSFPYGYGDSPGCNGLTPSQTNGLYGAPRGGAKVEGRGATAAVFELAAYQQSDVAYWAHTFYGSTYTPPEQNVLVDGGPLAPACPAGDTCPPGQQGFNGDVEVDADIQMELTVAPALSHLLVYEAPNDNTGQTSLDEYAAVANQDAASTLSSSWGLCENDINAAYAQEENTIFEQMALQGQSFFSASGDTGAFGCIRDDGTTIVNLGDPGGEPWVTSVGGTSFTFDNPGTTAHPTYPNNGDEMVWNPDNLCNESANEGGTPTAPLSGYFWCANAGAGNGGSSQYFGRPSYQAGPGVQNPYSTTGNGSTQCALARIGTPCREAPDVSANADGYTPYAEYCLPPPSQYVKYSNCAIPPIGWFPIGGTSLSSPLWAALIADRDGYFGTRVGSINTWVYGLRGANYRAFFHDITGARQSMNNNGLFPTTSGFDEATGLGSPNFAAFITRPS